MLLEWFVLQYFVESGFFLHMTRNFSLNNYAITCIYIAYSFKLWRIKKNHKDDKKFPDLLINFSYALLNLLFLDLKKPRIYSLKNNRYFVILDSSAVLSSPIKDLNSYFGTDGLHVTCVPIQKSYSIGYNMTCITLYPACISNVSFL